MDSEIFLLIREMAYIFKTLSLVSDILQRSSGDPSELDVGYRPQQMPKMNLALLSSQFQFNENLTITDCTIIPKSPA